MATENEMSDGGHCFGFSVLSLLLYSHQWPPFDPGPTFGLQLAGSEELQRTIAYAFAFQTLSTVRAHRVEGSPNQILDFLRSHLRPGETETWTMAIFRRGDEPAGHAITPYAVDDLGGGLFDVLVYDNNWPGMERRVRFDTSANTWRYFASQNPDEKEWLYDGDAKTEQSMILFPSTPGLGFQPCWFCLGKEGHRVQYNEIRLVPGNPDDHANLVITDREGRRTGLVAGRRINRIPGVKVIFPVTGVSAGRNSRNRLWDDTSEPIYRIPRDLDFQVTVDGARLKDADEESLVLLGPGYDVGVDGLVIRPDQRAVLDVSDSGNGLSYRHPDATDSPSASFGLDGPKSDFRLRAQVVNAPDGSQLELRNRRQDQEVVLRNSAPAMLRYRIRLIQLTTKHTFEAKGVFNMADDESAVVGYGHLDDRRSAIVTIRDPGGPDRTIALKAQIERG